MKKVAPPTPRPPLHGISLLKPAPPSHPAQIGAGSCPSRNGELPLAVPADRCFVPAGGCAIAPGRPASPRPPRALIERLQAQIRAIERSGGVAAPCAPVRDASPFPAASTTLAHCNQVIRTPWSLGAAEIDARLEAAGLDPHGVHEIKPGSAIGDWGAAAGFLLRLAVRRLRSPDAAPKAHILWCATERMTAELGQPHGAGLLRLGLDPGCLILVEARRAGDLLWALEQGLKSRSLLLAIGLTDEIGSVPGRRLSLAADAGATPVLLLTHPMRAPAAATASRWRISARPGAPHQLDFAGFGCAPFWPRPRAVPQPPPRSRGAVSRRGVVR